MAMAVLVAEDTDREVEGNADAEVVVLKVDKVDDVRGPATQ